jgi:hypothetical protein
MPPILYARLGLENGKGNVLLVHHRGIAPYKKSEIAPVSIVSAVLLETILAVENVRPALSSLTGVPVPALCPIRPAASAIEIDHRRLQPTLHYDVAMAAESALDEEMTTIATRAAARMLIRRGAVAATKEPYQPLMDIAMLISNAATRADTRSWSMLPSCIDLYHFDLEPGRHQLQAGSRTLDLEVPSKGLTLVEVFQPSSEKINFITKEPS